MKLGPRFRNHPFPNRWTTSTAPAGGPGDLNQSAEPSGGSRLRFAALLGNGFNRG